SERCDMAGARAMHDAFGLRLMFCFELAQGEYHTNVMMTSLAGRAVILAPDGFADPAAACAAASPKSSEPPRSTRHGKALQHRNVHVGAPPEAELFVQRNRGMVVFPRVQEWRFAARFDHRRNRPRQTAR